MFQLANLVLLLIAAGNLWAMLAGKAPSVRQVATDLIGAPGGLEKLHVALAMGGLAQVYLVALTFPLKALNFYVGLGWSMLMLCSVLETVHTGRKLVATVSADARDAAFPLHDSLAYRAYQVLFNAATIAACASLLLPR